MNGTVKLSQSAPWYRGASKDQWKSFWSSYIGWMLDIMDLMLFAMIIVYAGKDLGFNKGMAGMIASATLIATAFGGLIFGFLADRIGRAKSMILSILCYSVGTALCGFSDSVAQLIAFRVLVGLGVGGEWSAGAALITETWPAKHRGKVMAVVQSAFATGYALAAIVAAIVLPIAGWRWVFAVGLLPALFGLWIRRHVKEPEIWKNQTKRLTFGETVGLLFGEYRRNTIIGLSFTAAAMCGYWGLFTWIPTFLALPVSEGGAGFSLVKSTLWVVIMQAGAVVGFITFGYIADAIGRKKAFIWFFLGAAVMVPLYTMVKSPTMLLVLGPVVAYLGSGFYSGFAPLFAELYPTTVRATAQGFIYNTGRATSALAPAMVGFLAGNYGVASALGMTSAFFVLAALLVAVFVKETKGVELD